MQAQWIFSSTFLPYTGEPIEFMLEDRKQPIHGTFANGIFRSRWADYNADRVQSWRESESDPSAEPIAMQKVSARGTFITTLKRLTSLLSKGSNANPIALPHSHARTTAVPAVPMRARVVATRRIDSNQISS